jgi:flagellar biosynthesis/type III secretory pathway chaperone
MEEKIFKELYLFMKDYLKVLIKAYEESLNLRKRLRENKIEKIEKMIPQIENLDIKIKMLENTKESLLSKLAKSLDMNVRNINWELVKKRGGKEIAELGKLIEDKVKNLVDANIVNKIIIEKLIMFNSSLLNVIRNDGESLYSSDGNINSSHENSMLEEV